MSIRQTKIVCTLGPATTGRDVLRGLLDAGMDAARFNLSYGTHEEHARTLALLRDLTGESGRQVAVLFDLPGPKLRTGPLPGGAVDLRVGDTVRLVPDGGPSPAARAGEPVVPYRYPALSRDVRPGNRAFLQDGEIALQVQEIVGEEVICTVLNGGRLRQHAGINLPGVQLSVPAVTAEDFRHLEFGLAQGADYVALSFVEGPDEIRGVREFVEQRGGAVRLVAKIERRRALESIDEIVAAADAIMVARGDLAVETSPEEVPIIQKALIATCNRRGVPVITATQMLESMVQNPRPTRAEAADVANAVFDGTDALMLSGETAIGRFPVEAITAMARIAERAEAALPYDLILRERARTVERSTAEAIALASVQAAETLGAAVIVAATTTGSTALRVARFRPHRPILALTMSEATLRRLRLVWGVHPVVMPEVRDFDEVIAAAQDAARRTGLARPGDDIVVTAGYPMGQSGTTNLLKVVRVE